MLAVDGAAVPSLFPQQMALLSTTSLMAAMAGITLAVLRGRPVVLLDAIGMAIGLAVGGLAFGSGALIQGVYGFESWFLSIGASLTWMLTFVGIGVGCLHQPCGSRFSRPARSRSPWRWSTVLLALGLLCALGLPCWPWISRHCRWSAPPHVAP